MLLRRQGRLRRLLVLVAWTTSWLLIPLASVGTTAAATVPNFDHIFMIVMENHSYSEIIGNTSQAPYLNSLAGQYGVATNYHATTHPSLPNYLSLVGGDTFGVTSDCTTCYVNAPNLAVDRIETSGRSWKAYMDGMPAPCTVGDAYPYMQKHDPLMYFNDVRLNSAECQKIVPFTSLAGDLSATSTTPSFVWITPDMCHDMHDCSISSGDSWLQQNVPAILNSPAFTTQHSLLVITWDEDDSSQSNQVATLVIAPDVPAGYRSGAAYTHYSLLKTIESAWGLAPLTTNDGNAAPMSDFFSSGTPSTTAPSPPLNVTARAGSRSATVSWSPPADTGGCAISSYTVTSSPQGISTTVSGSTTTATLMRLKTGRTYTFTVTATNCAGTSAPSAPSNSVVPTR